ncbi:Sec-independent protein translocase protein TatA [Gammaproteobacteria bacterium]
MGLSGIGFSELLLLFVIVVLLFGTKKLANVGSDLGAAIRGFRQAMHEGAKTPDNSTTPPESPASLSHSAPPSPPPGSGVRVETSQHSSGT